MGYEKAIVIGSGIAGLAAARVLAKYFQAVTLVDRDDIPQSPDVRRGAAQGYHIHTLLPGGLEILQDLFPTLERDLDEQGGHAAGPAQWYALTPHGKTYRVSRYQPTPLDAGSTPRTRAQTRPLLEHCIRQQVEALPNVSVRYGTTVSDLILSEGRATGVRLKGTDEELNAGLVIDASGRDSLTLDWLDTHGFPRPPEEAVHCDFAYATMFVHPNDNVQFDDVGFLISSAHEGDYVKRGGSIVRVEGGKWQVTLAGRLGDYPPKSVDGFLEYISTLHSPALSNLLKDTTPVEDPKQYLFPRSVNRHYQKLTIFPEGLVTLGDALCHINPGYAQGMSTSCRQVAELDAVLAHRHETNQPLTGLWKDFFPRAYDQTRAPWLFAALIDFSKKGTTGDFPDEPHAVSEIKRLNKLADKGDLEAATLIDSVFDMQQPLSAL